MMSTIECRATTGNSTTIFASIFYEGVYRSQDGAGGFAVGKQSLAVSVGIDNFELMSRVPRTSPARCRTNRPEGPVARSRSVVPGNADHGGRRR